jgi:glycosyltransferase involved in cell wall biosynthesis
MLPALRAKAQERGISDNVHFPGLVSDRGRLLKTMRQSDIFLYCHKTRESARCLGEALASGCPLVGYASDYSTELVSHHGGGRFASISDWGGLAGIIQHLDRNRNELRDLIRRAARSGRLYDREKMMQKRVDLIKKYLQPNRHNLNQPTTDLSMPGRDCA